jgi:hypothetical protein
MMDSSSSAASGLGDFRASSARRRFSSLSAINSEKAALFDGKLSFSSVINFPFTILTGVIFE